MIKGHMPFYLRKNHWIFSLILEVIFHTSIVIYCMLHISVKLAVVPLISISIGQIILFAYSVNAASSPSEISPLIFKYPYFG